MNMHVEINTCRNEYYLTCRNDCILSGIDVAMNMHVEINTCRNEHYSTCRIMNIKCRIKSKSKGTHVEISIICTC